jgi:AcrR family transcriptional regulator
MIRNQITWTANTLFARKGINSVSMEQIAAAAGVHVEAVMREFNGMGDLVEECVKQNVAKIEKDVSTAQSISQSPLETLILVMFVCFKEKSNYCDAFYKDLGTYSTTNKQLGIYLLKNQDRCAEFFMKCMEEGYFVSHENKERMALIYMEEISNMASKYQHKMIRTLLRGICTDKGLIEAARIQTIIELKIKQIETIE